MKTNAQSRISFSLLLLFAALALGAAANGRAASITFDLNQPDTALAGTAVPYATVNISTQGTGSASFSVVADGPYSLEEIVFAINPIVFFVPPSVADSTGAVQFGDIGVKEIALGGPFQINTITTDNFGGFGFGYGSRFGTVKSVSFTLAGPFINNIADVIRPNQAGFLAAAKVYDGTVSGFVAGNGSPTSATAVPEPRTMLLILVPIAVFWLYGRAKRRHRKSLASVSCFSLFAVAAATNASATTIVDTFRFTQDGWTTIAANSNSSGLVFGDPVPGAILAGSFTGTEEADGSIQLADLTSFVVDYTDLTKGEFFSLPSIPAYLFSYNPNAGTSGLTYAISGGTGISIACGGAAASLYPKCLPLQGVQNPPGTNGAIFPTFLPENAGFLGEVVTPNFPVLTLISRTTVPDPVNAPEPNQAALLCLGATLSFTVGLRRRLGKRPPCKFLVQSRRETRHNGGVALRSVTWRPSCQLCRNATIGSTELARRAGM